MKPIAVEHSETIDLPALPIAYFGPETDRYIRHPKIQIGQIGQLLAVGITVLDHHSPSTTDPLGNGREFY
jgi:hypothetical protein